MKSFSEENRIAIFNQNIGNEVIVKPWSRTHHPKATLAPDYKIGKILSVSEDSRYLIKTIEGNTAFKPIDLIILKRDVSDMRAVDAIELSKIHYKITTSSLDVGLKLIEAFANNEASMPLNLAQYLMLHNYALPYLQYSVKDLIELEVYKISNS